MKRLLIIFFILMMSVIVCYAGEIYVSCNIQTCIHMGDVTSEPMQIKRYFYVNTSTHKVYDKTHKILVSEYENGIYTIHFREADRTERLIYDSNTKQIRLFGKQRRGYYYPWVLYNGYGDCITTAK